MKSLAQFFRTPTKGEWTRILRIASSVSGKLPSSDDGPIALTIKLLSIVDAVRTDWQKGEDQTVIGFFAGMKDTQRQKNQHFVDLFFHTPLKDYFQLEAIALSDYVELVKATSDKIGSLYFVQYLYGSKPSLDAAFWYNTAFDFESALALLWQCYEDQLQLNLKLLAEGEYTLQCSPIPPCKGLLLGRGPARLETFVARQKRFTEQEIQRTYLLLGPPGMGKSTFALRAAAGQRIVRIDSAVLTQMGVHDLDLLLSGLRPDYLLIDDIDRIESLPKVLPSVFTMLTEYKAKHKKLTVLFSANSADDFDEAFLRPERIDSIVEFPLPDETERREVLGGFLKEYSLPMSDLELLMPETEGLSYAHLREVALQVKYGSVAEAIEDIHLRKRLLKNVKKGPSKDEPDEGMLMKKAD